MVNFSLSALPRTLADWSNFARSAIVCRLRRSRLREHGASASAGRRQRTLRYLPHVQAENPRRLRHSHRRGGSREGRPSRTAIISVMQADLVAAGFWRDRGSFRDPDGYIVQRAERIFRVILPAAAERWRQFVASGLAEELQSADLLIPTRELDPKSLEADFPAPSGALVVEHERIPFVSYPYEWTFEMLRDAALLQLRIMDRALRHKWILKDATAYNVQFRGAAPVFIDALSFEPWRQGEPWAGYNQFCRTMLYPLMLEAYKQVPFHSWLRSELEGIDPLVFSHLFRGL